MVTITIPLVITIIAGLAVIALIASALLVKDDSPFVLSSDDVSLKFSKKDNRWLVEDVSPAHEVDDSIPQSTYFPNLIYPSTFTSPSITVLDYGLHMGYSSAPFLKRAMHEGEMVRKILEKSGLSIPPAEKDIISQALSEIGKAKKSLDNIHDNDLSSVA